MENNWICSQVSEVFGTVLGTQWAPSERWLPLSLSLLLSTLQGPAPLWLSLHLSPPLRWRNGTMLPQLLAALRSVPSFSVWHLPHCISGDYFTLFSAWVQIFAGQRLACSDLCLKWVLSGSAHCVARPGERSFGICQRWSWPLHHCLMFAPLPWGARESLTSTEMMELVRLYLEQIWGRRGPPVYGSLRDSIWVAWLLHMGESSPLAAHDPSGWGHLVERLWAIPTCLEKDLENERKLELALRGLGVGRRTWPLEWHKEQGSSPCSFWERVSALGGMIRQMVWTTWGRTLNARALSLISCIWVSVEGLGPK